MQLWRFLKWKSYSTLMDGFTLAALTSAIHSFNSKTVMSWSFAATSECGTSVMYDAVLRVL